MVNSFLFIWFFGAIVVGLVRVSSSLAMGRGFGKEIIAALIGIGIPAIVLVLKNVIQNHRKVINNLKNRDVEKP